MITLGRRERSRWTDPLLPDLPRRHRVRGSLRQDRRRRDPELDRQQPGRRRPHLLRLRGRQVLRRVGAHGTGGAVDAGRACSAEERGFTLIELLLAATLMIIVLGATLTSIEGFWKTNKVNNDQNDAQDIARTAIDRLAQQLRNLALPTPTSPNSIDIASSYDLVFKTAEPSRRRVRYCLKTDAPESPGNGKLYMQTQAGPAREPADPAVPPTATCPGPTGPDVGNDHGGRRQRREQGERQGPPGLLLQRTRRRELPKITLLRSDLFVDVDPDRRPLESSISTGVYLRNQNQVPTASFSVASGGTGTRRFLLNGSGSTDPEGRTLSLLLVQRREPGPRRHQLRLDPGRWMHRQGRDARLHVPGLRRQRHPDLHPPCEGSGRPDRHLERGPVIRPMGRAHRHDQKHLQQPPARGGLGRRDRGDRHGSHDGHRPGDLRDRRHPDRLNPAWSASETRLSTSASPPSTPRRSSSARTGRRRRTSTPKQCTEATPAVTRGCPTPSDLRSALDSPALPDLSSGAQWTIRVRDNGSPATGTDYDSTTDDAAHLRRERRREALGAGRRGGQGPQPLDRRLAPARGAGRVGGPERDHRGPLLHLQQRQQGDRGHAGHLGHGLPGRGPLYARPGRASPRVHRLPSRTSAGVPGAGSTPCRRPRTG